MSQRTKRPNSAKKGRKERRNPIEYFSARNQLSGKSGSTRRSETEPRTQNWQTGVKKEQCESRRRCWKQPQRKCGKWMREKSRRGRLHTATSARTKSKNGKTGKKKRQKETGRSAWQHTLSGSATTDLKRLGECFSEVHTKCIGDSGESQAGGGPVIESTATAMWGRTKPTKKIGQKRTEKKKRNLESICSLPRRRSSVRKCTPKKKKKVRKKEQRKRKIHSAPPSMHSALARPAHPPRSHQPQPQTILTTTKPV